MGERYLIDTNILIYYVADAIPHKEINVIDRILQTSFNISVITKIEFLGWNKHTEEGFKKAMRFVSFANVIPVTDEIADITISLRRRYNTKLADAVITATAIYTNYKLITRNEKDFAKIPKTRI